MNQIENQQHRLKLKKLNWKKIMVLGGIGTILVTATAVSTWAITKKYLKTKVTPSPPVLQPSIYKLMNAEQFDNIHNKFYAINNYFIKALATKELMFYLPTTDFREIKTDLSQITFNLTPNLSKMLTEKMINTVGSNLRVWGLNEGYAFNPNLTKIDFNLNSWTLNGDKDIKFDLNLGYTGSTETFEVKGELKDSEGITNPISDFTTENLTKIFEQANTLFDSELNRNGFFVGLDFIGEKGDNPNRPWIGNQFLDLDKVNSQAWDYTLSSLKNFNLVQENVFTDGRDLFNLQTGLQNEYPETADFGATSWISAITVTLKNNPKVNFRFTGSFLQNNQWGNY